MRDVRVTIPAKRRNKLLLNKSPFIGNVKLAYIQCVILSSVVACLQTPSGISI